MRKRILVTGSSGLIGRYLVKRLQKDPDNWVIAADVTGGYDLTHSSVCHRLCTNIDEIYHLVGVTGSPRRTKQRPIDFMVPMLQCDTNMIYAAQVEGVQKFLYTSSIAVLNPESDRFPAWAKMTAETLIEAMKTQYPDGTKYFINRPANVYGYDPLKFDSADAMVITSLIRKFMMLKEIEIWGDGSQIRDFIHADDVARAMIHIMENEPSVPVNVCSGQETTIKEVVEIIASQFPGAIYYYNNIFAGDQKRVMDTSTLDKLGFECHYDIKDGLIKVIETYKQDY